jgi:hypothetical protein
LERPAAQPEAAVGAADGARARHPALVLQLRRPPGRVHFGQEGLVELVAARLRARLRLELRLELGLDLRRGERRGAAFLRAAVGRIGRAAHGLFFFTNGKQKHNDEDDYNSFRRLRAREKTVSKVNYEINM